jgi:hypothetical protein
MSLASINPGDWAVSKIEDILTSGKRASYRNMRAQHDQYAKNKLNDASTMQVVHRATPTPENTGAPVPGYRKRGPINPSTTGAPMPGTLKTKTAIHPITGAAVNPVPVKRVGAKPTPAGTKPKKK